MSNAEQLHEVTLTYSTESMSKLHWHEDLQIIYQLSGKSVIQLRGDDFTLNPRDFILINPLELHQTSNINGSYITFDFNTSLINETLSNKYFCYSEALTSIQQKHIDELRGELADLFRIYFEEKDKKRHEVLSHSYNLFSILDNYFITDDSNFLLSEPRAFRIVRYIYEHYTEPLSLNDLADSEYISSNYLSQFIRKEMNTTFTDLLQDIRLSHAITQLRDTDKSITEIALDNGFPRTDSFIDKFKRKYQMPPGKFRKQNKNQFTVQSDKEMPPSGNEFQSLLDYATKSISTESMEQRSQLVSIDINSPGTEYQADWNKLINGGYAEDLLQESVLNQLSQLVDVIDLESIRFHGIFSDALHLYDEDDSGQVKLNYAYMDILLDKLTDMGLSLYMELGYLPKALSAQKTGEVYQSRSYIGFPSSMSKWIELITQFVLHCINRYGITQVRKWRFALFSIVYADYGFLTREEYSTLYMATYKAVKGIDPSLSFGGPGFAGTLLVEGKNEKANNFLKSCVEQNCVPDFVSLHSYPHSSQEILTQFNHIVHKLDFSKSFLLSDNENFLHDVLKEARKLLTSNNMPDIPIVISEWDSTIWQHDMCNDTCYKASFLIKNLTETMGQTAGKGYWTLSDLVSDLKPDPHIFHGGHGLFTRNGIPKSGFQALKLMANMGTYVISQGNGWYVTRSAQGIEVLLYNYSHYSTMYRNFLVLDDENEYYSAFRNNVEINYQCHLDVSKEMPYSCEFIRIDRSSGSPLDTWIDMGVPSQQSPSQTKYLQSRSEPIRWVEEHILPGDLNVTLPPLGVLQILIRPL